MSSSANEDLEHSKITGMEHSDEMTIEFLRARLLSERSVTKSARQRANDLSKRVAELEEQLKFASFQRKKAEKATSDVLAILENCGITDASDGFDSYSEQDNAPDEFGAHSGSVMIKETSTNMKIKKNDAETYSSSEFEFLKSNGRSLSWKSTKNSQFSLEKKKYLDSVSRRSSVASNSSSARRSGKSCRRIRRREIRLSEELQTESPKKVTCSRDIFDCSDSMHYELRETTERDHEKNPLEGSVLNSNSETKKINGRYFIGHERDEEDMESALIHQVQLIGQYQEEEKAQREWKEKFRGNNSGQQDSCDPGIHSDVTEERYDNKSPELLSVAETSSSNNRETNQEVETSPPSNVEPETSNNPPSFPDTHNHKQNSQHEKDSDITARESLASEFSFPISENNNSTNSRNHHELVSISPNSSNNLGSVLEALQQAKLSLNQTLNSSSLVVTTTYSKTNDVDMFGIPVRSPGLFRLPTDNQFEANARANHRDFGGYPGFANFSTEIVNARFLSEPSVYSRSGFSPENGVHSCFANYPPEVASTRFLSEPFVDSRSPFSPDLRPTRSNYPDSRSPFSPDLRPTRSNYPGIGSQSSFANYPPEFASGRYLSEPVVDLRNIYSGNNNLYLTTPPRPYNSGIGSKVSPQRYQSQPIKNHFDPYVSSSDGGAPHLPFGEGSSRSSETGLPPLMRAPLYDYHDYLVRHDMRM